MNKKLYQYNIEHDTENFEIITYFLRELQYDSFSYDDNYIYVYIPDEGLINELSEILKGKGIDLKYDVIEIDNSWEKRLHGDFKAVEAGEYAVVSVDYIQDYKGDKEKIIINPGQGFGSGQHATTRQCMEVMQEIIRDNKIECFMEAGCGSSILSLLAYKLGIKDIFAFDIDEESVKNAVENQELNNCKFGTIVSGLTTFDKKYDLAVANILAHILIENSENIMSYIKEDGFLVLSGIENSQADGVLEAFKKLKVIKKVSYDEWTTFILKES